jgi:hypothetical protein
MARRRDLFQDVEIHGWQCRSRAIYKDVIARFPEASAADDATWELALQIGGECESFVDCELEHGLMPLVRYRAKLPTGRHVPDAVHLAVETLRTRLGWQLTPGTVVAGPISGILSQYEAAAASLPRKLRSQMLRGIAPWWELLGDKARSRDLVTEANRIDPQ